MRPTVSVVIPAYNVEPYVGDCLDSLLNQGVNDVQIVCVDDGSTDDTADILREYSRKHDAVTFVSQDHSGQSVARNNGLNRADGVYTIFCDADDLLAQNALNDLISCAESLSADIVYFDAKSFYENEDLKRRFGYYTDSYHRKGDYRSPSTGPQMLAEMAANGEWLPSAPLQFYRTVFLKENRLSFIPGIIHEDNAFSYCAALHAKSTTHIRRPLYLRRVRQQSTMTSNRSSKNVIGYFRCYLEMASASVEQNITDERILSVPHHVLMEARRIYNGLSQGEKDASSKAFAGYESFMFAVNVSEDAKLVERIESLQSELHAIKGSRRYALAEKLANIRNILTKK